MSALTSGNDIVDALASMQFTGNVIPQTWYKHIIKDTGKPDLLAIVLLSDIVYWYRPTEVRDEVTGQIVGYNKKFRADLLQRNYEQLAEQFGETKRNVRDAITRLESFGIIRRQFRTIETATGVRCNNVLFIELVPERLFDITYCGGETTPMTPNCNRSDKSDKALSQKNVIGDTQDCQTNTMNTAKNTTEITSSSSKTILHEEDEFKKRINYSKAYATYSDTATVIHDELLKDSNRDIAHDMTEQVFAELCKSISQYASPIRNLSAYIRTCISNMVTGQRIKRRKSFSTFLQGDYDMDDIEQKILAN